MLQKNIKFKFKNARFIDAEKTAISACVNGQDLIIPALEGNRHYDAILHQKIKVLPYVEKEETDSDLSELEIRLTALESRLNITESDYQQARQKLLEEK